MSERRHGDGRFRRSHLGERVADSMATHVATHEQGSARTDPSPAVESGGATPAPAEPPWPTPEAERRVQELVDRDRRRMEIDRDERRMEQWPAPAEPPGAPAATEWDRRVQELSDRDRRRMEASPARWALRQAAHDRGMTDNLANVVYRLVDLKQLEYDENAEPTNAPAVVDALMRDRPDYFGVRPGSLDGFGPGSFDGGARTEYVVPEEPNTIMNRMLREQADHLRRR